ncbi:hypothetical protein [Pelotalea chapellei]|uniref:Uncharacterized protein n=1 Tax=Pelotalea chapellei TaxID=44671 RepID=A0ABS5U4U7_9BACT|nr:hypothetical protein [Pelotalea chapellei]MBT1070675.1 hypothetical protein [Pelotalea chapellei]
MREIVITKAEIKKGITQFRAAISKNLKKKQRIWTFPSGKNESIPTLRIERKEGVLCVGLPSGWNNRVPHLFCIEREGRALSPDVEINIPLDLDRRTGGALVKHRKDIWLCHRGNFNSFRGKIPKQKTLNHFEKWTVPTMDGEKESYVIPVGAVSSPSIIEEMFLFVEAVIELKEQAKLKTSIKQNEAETSKWSNWEEFEGKKSKGGRTSDGYAYEYLHGPLCNSLNKWLKRWNKEKNNNFATKQNSHVDGAIIKNGKAVAIFEVKTSTSFSSQIYSAIGQLIYYKHRHGTDSCSLFLVLPASCNFGPDQIKMFSNLGIVIIVKKRSFETLDGKSLQNVLNEMLIINEATEIPAPNVSA